MRNYLVVAQQTATSNELLDVLRGIAARDDRTAFTLLVPATPLPGPLTWTEGRAIAAARQAGAVARGRFERAGLRVEATLVGDASPVQAMADAFMDGREYAGVVLATQGRGAVRWLGLDVQSRARRRFGRSLISVVIARGRERAAWQPAGAMARGSASGA